jgi:glutaredoxin
MKFILRTFFRTLRAVLGPFLLLANWITRPRGVVRPAAAQHAIDARTRALALYHFPTCPFCLKARRAMRRLSLDIELRNAQHDPAHRQALLAGGGKLQTPCLLIAGADGQATWMYESAAIMAYLEHEFGG